MGFCNFLILVSVLGSSCAPEPQGLSFLSTYVTSPVVIFPASCSGQNQESRQLFCLVPCITAELCLTSVSKEGE